MQLIDKVALVTGAGKRLGREIALALAREGCDVVVHYNRSRTEAEETANEIRALGRQAWCVGGDFSNSYAPAVTMRTAWDMAGWIDILVNNASAYSRDAIEDAPVEAIEESWRVNALAPILLAREMLRLSRESEILPVDWGGRVINILDRDVARTPPQGKGGPYWLAKKTLEAFTKSFAREAAPRMSVNAVAPGPAIIPENPALSEPAGTLPLGVRPLPSDIADAVLFLAHSIAVTGQIIYVDSGQNLI